jgi:MYXO-CTERM domain-containing protein
MSDSRTPADIEADIAVQRQELAHTIDQLSAKFDVKSQAKARLSEARDTMTTDGGSPRPELLAAAGVLLVVCALLVWRRRR